MHYMVVEHFKNGPDPVYRRFREHGRMAPEGLTYVSSWVDQELTRCFQVMEASDPRCGSQTGATSSTSRSFQSSHRARHLGRLLAQKGVHSVRASGQRQRGGQQGHEESNVGPKPRVQSIGGHGQHRRAGLVERRRPTPRCSGLATLAAELVSLGPRGKGLAQVRALAPTNHAPGTTSLAAAPRIRPRLHSLQGHSIL
jgi:hypothetical protein